MQTDTSVIKLDTNLIIPNKYQPRKVFDENALNTLAESIKKYGILNPILVRKKDDKYEIIAGERRFRAAKLIGLTEVPVIVKNIEEQQMAELALIENIERQNLSSIEEAKSYEEIMKIGNQTQESLAQKLGKSQSTIANKIRLLSLPIEIQDALSKQKISERHARSLLSVKEKEKQIEILNRIINEKLTVKETECLINEKEFTKQEMKNAIDDIMKSLKMVNEPLNKEEEKEDDNMNNGNFFPNFDNNIMNNNASLNMMNAQSMNQMPMGPTNETVMPTMMQPTEEPVMMDQPLFNPAAPMTNPEPMGPAMPMENNPIPDFGQFGGIPTMDQNFNMNVPQPTEEPAMMDQPLFNPAAPMTNPEPIGPTMPMENNPIPDFGQFGGIPTMDQNFNMSTPQPTEEPVMMDQPLFNQEFTAPIENTGFEVPVVMPLENSVSEPTEFSTPKVDKLTEIQDYLAVNGYTFKTFSNATEDCIIIEIPKNY